MKRKILVGLIVLGMVFAFSTPLVLACGGEGQGCPMAKIMEGKGFGAGKSCPMMEKMGYKKHHGDKGKKCELEKKLMKKFGIIFKNKEELEISDETLAKLKELKIATKKDLIMKNAEIEIISIDAKAKLWSDPIDVDGLNGLIDKKYDIKKAKAKVLVQAYADLKALLSDEQKEELKALFKAKMKK